ncbi:hypothetical protein DL768_005755 [Monosporascus sp. mg162]|nr:hypothetical protein DL768_005755 [Monosporascus sp. mg162]
MVKFATLAIATLSAFAGNAAAAPPCTCTPGVTYCGFQLLDDRNTGQHRCSQSDLVGTPGGSDPWSNLYVCSATGDSAGNSAVFRSRCTTGCQPPNNNACNGVDACCPRGATKLFKA